MRYVYAHFPINVNVIEYNPTLSNELSVVMAKLSRFAISWERSLCVELLFMRVSKSPFRQMSRTNWFLRENHLIMSLNLLLRFNRSAMSEIKSTGHLWSRANTF